MPSNFRVVSGPAAGRQINIPDEFQIGRAADEDGRLGDDPELSRTHARVTRNAQGQLVLEDLGSTNGTAVNGQRITAPTVLKPGDTVQLGKTTLQLQDEGGLQATALGGAAAGGAAAGAAAAPPPPTAPTAPLASGGPQSPGAPPPPPPPGGGPAFGGGAGAGGPGLGGPGGPGQPGQPAGSSGGGRKGLLIGLGALAGVAAIVIAIVLLAGGGDGGNDEDEVRAAVTSFFENDCGVLTDDYREELFGDQEGTPEEACEESAEEGDEETDFDITSVSVDGATAEAEVDVEDQEATFELTEQDGEWKVDGIDSEVAMAGSSGTTATTPTTPTTPTETTPTETQEQSDPRRTEAIATLQALIDAIHENDEQVFCGLLSPRQAQRLVGGPGGDAAIARCVEVAGDVDLGENVPDEIDVTGVRISGNQASVRLTTGERFTLVRRRGRYVVNSGLG